MFLGVIRKYMQVRGAMNQKDLAELTDVGVSTISRFLSQKTREMDPQLIAQIVAKLNIPIHEIIDFVEEEYTERFIRLVKFHKGEEVTVTTPIGEIDRRSDERRQAGTDIKKPQELSSELEDTASALGSAPKSGPKSEKNDSNLPIRGKLERLTPRQKAFLNDFLDLDMEGRDLLVDLGNSVFRFFRQKGMEF